MSETKPSAKQPRSARGGILGRIVVAAVLAGFFYLALWLTVFDAVTSALAASGIGVVLIAGSAASDAVATIIDAIAEMLAAVLAAIGAVLASILSIFS